MSETRERALALALLAGLLQRERRTVRALLRAERATLRALRAAVAPVAARAALAVSGVRVDTRDAMVAVRRATPAMREATERALLDARAAARRAARQGGSSPARGRVTHHEVVSAAAHAAASSYAAAWGAAAMAGVLAREEEGKRGFAPAFSPAPLDYRLRRIAATETARAFNAERVADTRARFGQSAGVFQVWSAVLDRSTCAYCFDRDGRTVALHDGFGEALPAHVNCRCVWEFIYVPHPERLEDIEFDYDLFKREMRDVIRERRTTSERHAADFVHASMGAKRSPVVLTKKFASFGP